MQIGEFNHFDQEPYVANWIENFQDKYILDNQYTVYLNGDEKQHIEAQCQKYTIKAPIKPNIQMPKKYPTANVDLSLTPGVYTALTNINQKSYRAYIYCNQSYESGCYIVNPPNNINQLDQLELNQLDYLTPNQLTPHIKDFINSCLESEQLKTYILNNRNNPNLMNLLNAIIKKQIDQQQINSKYINILKSHEGNLNNYVKLLIYRIILINAKIIPFDIDTITLKKQLDSNQINLSKIKSKIQNPIHIELLNNILSL